MWYNFSYSHSRTDLGVGKNMYREPLSSGNFYHLFSRGVDKRDIFMDKNDYLRFILLLYLSNSSTKVSLGNEKDWFSESKFPKFFSREPSDRLVDIGCFCLMTNHFHLLIRIPEGADLNTGSEFMRKLLTAYVMYFNKKYNRSGSLFEQRFKSKIILTDRYLKYIFSYIHLNPVKQLYPLWKGQKFSKDDIERVHLFLENYKYFSYNEYSGNERLIFSKILNKSVFPDYFATGKDFLEELNHWLEFKND